MSLATQGSNANNPTAGLIKPMQSTPNGVQPGFINTPKTYPTTVGRIGVASQPNSQGSYGTKPSSSAPVQTGLLPTHPVSSITTNADGSTKHTFDTSADPTPTPPAPNTNFAQNLGATATAGTQTPNETQTQSGLITASQETPQEKEAYKRKQDLENEYAIQQKAIQGSPIPLEFQQGRGQIVANQFGMQEQAAQTGIQSAVTAAGQGITGAQGAYSGAQTQAQRDLAAKEAVAGLTAPQQVSPTSAEYNPGTNTYGQNSGAPAGVNGLGAIGALTQQQQQGADVQTMTSSLGQTSSLIQKTKSDIANDPTFNVASVPLANALQSWIATNVVSSPQYANIINDLSEIANTIAPVLGTPGNPTNMKTIIAQELVPKLMQGQDIGTVLDNLEANANLKINAARSSSQNNSVSNPQNGAVQAGGYGFKQVNGKWVPS